LAATKPVDINVLTRNLFM